MPISPVIIVGMHRSGTTMVTKMLENLGLFVGEKKEINNEALFFWDINNWIFDIANCRADLPHNFQYLNPAAQKVIETDLKYFTKSSRRISFLGWEKSIKYKDICDIDFPWGWKDPKNSFTIDLWKSVFSHPKVLHIYRNPIDSVSSFIERDLELKNRFRHNWKKRLKRIMLISKNYHANFRLYNLEEGYNLWEEYVSKCLALEKDFPDMLHVRYEDFLERPVEHLQTISDFCGLNVSEQAILEQVKSVRSDRAFAFVNHNEGRAAYMKVQHLPIMQQLGYDNIPL